MKYVISQKESTHHGRPGVDGYYYNLPSVSGGTTVAFAEFTGEHGERTIGNRERIYYILEGSARFLINGEEFEAHTGDLVTVPALATYNLWPKTEKVKVLLYLELIKF